MTFPPLERARLEPTRDALHAYAKVLGGWLKMCRARRKHWWHASLRPSVRGLTTGVVYGPVAFELELNLMDSRLEGRAGNGARLTAALTGQRAGELAREIETFLGDVGASGPELPAPPDSGAFDYDPAQARLIAGAFQAVAAALAELRAALPEETSPIQVWPHHFDMSMLWLPGLQISGEDPADEESADKQMNLGFVLGDAGVAEPYFYVTAYPTPRALADLPLPAGATWHTESFTGAVLPYAALVATADPQSYLLGLWHTLLEAGRRYMPEAD